MPWLLDIVEGNGNCVGGNGAALCNGDLCGLIDCAVGVDAEPAGVEMLFFGLEPLLLLALVANCLLAMAWTFWF